MKDSFSGKVWVLGDDIDTDIIIPTEYLARKTVKEMAPYAFSPLRPELAGRNHLQGYFSAMRLIMDCF